MSNKDLDVGHHKSCAPKQLYAWFLQCTSVSSNKLLYIN